MFGGTRVKVQVDFYVKHAQVASALEDEKTPTFCKISRGSKIYQTSLRVPSNGQAIWNENLHFECTLMSRKGKLKDKIFDVQIIQKNNVLYNTTVNLVDYFEEQKSVAHTLELSLLQKNKKSGNLLLVTLKITPKNGKGSLQDSLSSIESSAIFSPQETASIRDLPSFGNKVDLRMDFGPLKEDDTSEKQPAPAAKQEIEQPAKKGSPKNPEAAPRFTLGNASSQDDDLSPNRMVSGILNLSMEQKLRLNRPSTNITMGRPPSKRLPRVRVGGVGRGANKPILVSVKEGEVATLTEEKAGNEEEEVVRQPPSQKKEKGKKETHKRSTSKLTDIFEKHAGLGSENDDLLTLPDRDVLDIMSSSSNGINHRRVSGFVKPGMRNDDFEAMFS